MVLFTSHTFINFEGLWDDVYGLSSLSEKTRESNHWPMSLQRQHVFLSYSKNVSVGWVGVELMISTLAAPLSHWCAMAPRTYQLKSTALVVGAAIFVNIGVKAFLQYFFPFLLKQPHTLLRCMIRLSWSLYCRSPSHHFAVEWWSLTLGCQVRRSC